MISATSSTIITTPSVMGQPTERRRDMASVRIDRVQVLLAAQKDLPLADRRRGVAGFAQRVLGDFVIGVARPDDGRHALVGEKIDQPRGRYQAGAVMRS